MDLRPGEGWGTAASLTLATVIFAVLSPGLLIFLPLSILLVALPPRKPIAVIFGAGLAVLGLMGSGPGVGPIWYIERGWVLILGAWFVISSFALPKEAFFPRALAALTAAGLTALLILLLVPEGGSVLDWVVTRRIEMTASAAAAVWSEASVSTEWAEQFRSAITRFAEIQILLYPALIALESLAALGVAWWAYRRLVLRDRQPLGRFREFRFEDHLVWMVIAGILLVLLPLGEVAVRTGSNILAFMGALYALRGAAILLVVFGLKGIGGVVIATLVTLFLYPIVLMTAILVGISDTWIDLRARRSAVRPDS